MGLSGSAEESFDHSDEGMKVKNAENSDEIENFANQSGQCHYYSIN